MPGFETMDRYQKALLWVATGFDRDGQATRSPTSVPIDVRWVWKQTKMLSPQGGEVSVDVTLIADREIPLDSVLWEGGYEDLAALLPGTGTANSTDVPTDDVLLRVVSIGSGNDIKQRHRRYVYGLKWLSDTIPGTQ